MKKPNLQFRQGDVLVERVTSATKIEKAEKREQGRVVLAHGEVTGHAHAIADAGVRKSAFREATALESRILVSDLEINAALVELRHEEHGTIPLERGNYRVTRQREYSPEAVRNVAD